MVTIMGVYDVIGALGPLFISKGKQEKSCMTQAEILDVEQIGFLYVAYSSLSPIIVVTGGVMTDKMGTTLTGLYPLRNQYIIVILIKC
jgi:hypothetical protein